MKRQALRGIAIVSVLAALSGCTAPAPAPSTHAASASRTPTPTPTPVDPQDTASWIVSPTGIGPLQLGASLAAVKATLPSFVASGCPNPAVTFLDNGSLSLAVASNDAGEIIGLDANQKAGTKPDSSGPHTALGIALGSTAQQIQIAYPAAVPTKLYSDVPAYYVVKDPGGAWLSFGYFDGSTSADRIGVWHGSIPPSEYCA